MPIKKNPPGTTMSYIEENLMPGENLLYRAKLHPIIFIGPLTVLLIGIWLFIVDGVLILLVGILWTVPTYITYSTSEFGLTNKRIIGKIGFIRRQSLEMFLTKVESVSIHQGIIARLLDYGKIEIIGTGGTKESFTKISKPLEFRKHIQEQVAIIQGIKK